MTAKDTKTISGNLSSHVAKDEPYFYLYDVDGTNAVLVYCCPDAAPTKSRMVYSTGKAPLADQLKSEGIRLKKVRDRCARRFDSVITCSNDFINSCSWTSDRQMS
jgi:hypothetical protein